MTIADEVRHEQGVVNVFYARLDELRTATRNRLAQVRRAGPSGSPQNRSERDAFATLYEDRLAQLEAVEERLAFGRLDLDDDVTRYIGRIGLTDADHVSLLTDWRAPAARAFYQATGAHSEGVRRRRHLVTRGRAVTAVEDEVFDLSDGAASATLAGEGALFAAMAAGRTGKMGDIVATIQAEQDAIIRSGLAGALVVQGGPGTGKTAVALHRAAFLLYAHRRNLERSGVLLIGPSHSFLRYIDQVLPSLGETGVVSATIGDLLPGVMANGLDEPAVAELKGRPLWAKAIARAVAARQRVPAQDQIIHVDGQRLVIKREDVRAAIARARRTHKPHNLARVSFVRDMLSRLADQYAKAQRFPLAPEDRTVLIEDLRTDRDVRVALNLAWLPITPERLVEDLFIKAHRLVEAAPELTPAQRRVLARPKGSPWTLSDIPLLDEAAEALGEDDELARAEAKAQAAERARELEYARQVVKFTSNGGIRVDAEVLADRFTATGPRLTTAERAATDREWVYGHIVVDEAQELSPMAWRMLVRRCPSRSMTIVGDVAQTSMAGGTRSWAQALDPFLRGSWRMAELTVNYRTPATVAEAAQRMARAAGLPISPLTSARDVPDSLRFIHVPDAAATSPSPAFVETVVQQVQDAVSAVVTDTGGQVAVIAAAAATVAAWRDRLTAAGLDASGADQADASLVVLTPLEAKGLEFDEVILIEPQAIVGHPMGASDLYVAMTRPTQRLVVVHAGRLPRGMEG